MKSPLLLFSMLLCFIYTVNAQETIPYWQQQVNYQINVKLDDKNHQLDGFEKIEYINQSPDTLHYIWFHLWPNAYSNNNTAFAKQLLRDSDGKKRLKSMKDTGAIFGLDFSANDKKLVTAYHPEYNDVLKVFLDKPLHPGSKTTISTPFKVALPTYISRMGHRGKSYMICQWYPKPAVYDRKGWHPMPYLDQGEFYSEFGNFDVSITLPSDYVLAATGTMQNQDELAYYKKLGAENLVARKNAEYKYQSKDPIKTIRYTCENLHDFSWFADKDFIIEYDTMLLPSGKKIDVFAYHPSYGNKLWDSAHIYMKEAVQSYSNWVGEYPYPVVQAVEGPKNLSSGGMEYPTITLITSPDANNETLDAILAHEIGHNWFYGILGSNERDHAWMDEGINSFYQFRYEAERYKSNSIFGSSLPAEVKRMPANEFLHLVFTNLAGIPAEKPIATASVDFPNKEDYAMVEYIKAATWMYLIEISIGKEKTDNAMRYYFDQWKFRHPYPEDFKQSLEEYLKVGMNDFFELLNKRGSLN